MVHSLRITIDDEDRDCLLLQALNKDRFTHHGFGTFLENVDPKEVSITQEALDRLLEQPYRRGLQGFEFWPQKILAWGDPSPEIIMPLSEVSIQDGAQEWIKLFDVKEEFDE